MQIFRTNRAQNLGPRGDELPEATQNADPDLQNTVNDFFNQDPLDQEPVLPDNPFDLLFVGTPSSGGPSRNDFAPSRVVTLEQWLMANPEGFKSIDLYKERMEQILQIRFIDRRDRFQEILNRGGLRSHEIVVLQQMIRDIDASIVVMRQEIEKAENRIGQQSEIYIREMSAMEDLNGDSYIGNPTGDNPLRIATRNGEEIIVDQNGNLATSPTLKPNYTPSLLSEESVRLIERNLHDVQPTGEELRTWDETFEIVPGAAGTLNAGIDVSVPEGFWVEAKEGKADINEEGQMKPKPFELIDGRYGQRPPAEDERDQWVQVRVTDLDIESEPVTHIQFADGPGNEVNEDGSRGGFVHYTFKGIVDGRDVTVLRMRFQGVETHSHHPLVSDGSNYIAATTVGIAVNGGDPEARPDSARISPIHIDASRYQSTGKVIPADSRAELLDTLGIPSDLEARVSRYSDTPPENGGLSDRQKAVEALHDNLYNGFLLDSSSPAGDEPMDEEIVNRFFDGNGNRTTSAAYIPRGRSSTDRSWESLRSGLVSVGLRGVIQGAGNDIIVVPPPDDESLRSLIAPGVERIDPSNPAYGTVVEAGRLGRNIVVSQGGDIYVQNATFFWREPDQDGSTRKDMIYVDSEFVNRSGENNPRLFFHIGDANPELVAIANGIDQDETIDEGEAREEGIPEEDMNEEMSRRVSSQNDDWYQGAGSSPRIAEYSAKANDIPGGLDWGNFAEAIGEQTQTATAEAWQAIMEEVIRLDPLADFKATEEGGWALPPPVQQEMEEGDAFFAEWEFFSDQEPNFDDLNLETPQNE